MLLHRSVTLLAFSLIAAGEVLANTASTAPVAPVLSTGIYDDGDPNIVYAGSWSSNTEPYRYNMTQTFSHHKGDTVSFTFCGNQVTYAYQVQQNMGHARVMIDGNVVSADLDEYAPIPVNGGGGASEKRVTYSGLSAGAHTITVTVLGIADASATDSYVIVDAFIVNQAQANLIQVSIRNWVSCSGQDESLGVAAAFKAARNNAFTLKVDCPVFIHVGMDVTRPIFIDNGTTVQFDGNGLFTVDNALVPAFVIANSSNIQLLNWNVQYTGGIPVNYNTGGYYDNGVFVPLAGLDKPGGVFNDRTLGPWLDNNRGIIFAGAGEPWGGPTDLSAIFYMAGSTSNVEVNAMKLFVPKNALGSRYIPVAFASVEGYNSWQTVTPSTPLTPEYMSVPSNLEFTNITLDGYYMGWQGTFQTALFNNITGYRYGDLQDDEGENVGGVGKWFAPPHLFYVNYNASQLGLDSNNVQITNVVDWGVRTGVARDKGGSDPGSGYALSLKIGANNSLVNSYYSYRPDGFLDVLTSQNLTIQNAIAKYNSAFLNNLYPGIRFPSAPYVNLTITNVSLTDTAPLTIYEPVASTADPGNSNIVFTGSGVVMNSWEKQAVPCPYIRGAQELSIKFDVNSSNSGYSVNAQTCSLN